MIEMFYSALSVKQAMSHTWLLSTWNVATEAEELNIYF
jgi:hypothetical protein